MREFVNEGAPSPSTVTYRKETRAQQVEQRVQEEHELGLEEEEVRQKKLVDGEAAEEWRAFVLLALMKGVEVHNLEYTPGDWKGKGREWR